MRYVVKVGEEMDLAEVSAAAGEGVTVQVTVGTRAPEKKGFSAWKVGTVGFLVFCALVVTPALAYGMATGDFVYLESIAQYFTDLAAAVVKAAVAALDKK